jgi:DNA-dependent RNA polymerase auxiliary subunit epsilon
MARFMVKYQMHNKKTNVTSGTFSVPVEASSAAEARQIFKSQHREQAPMSNKILSVVKTS